MKAIIFNLLFVIGVGSAFFLGVSIFALLLYLGSEYNNPDPGLILIWFRISWFAVIPATFLTFFYSHPLVKYGGVVNLFRRLCGGSPRYEWKVLVKGGVPVED